MNHTRKFLNADQGCSQVVKSPKIFSAFFVTGSTHLAHKAEHGVDMDSGAVLSVTLRHADLGDTTTICQTVMEATRILKRSSTPCSKRNAIRLEQRKQSSLKEAPSGNVHLPSLKPLAACAES
jgi:hypothetical protein